eukprot:910960-Amphidinium_carterae.1
MFAGGFSTASKTPREAASPKNQIQCNPVGKRDICGLRWQMNGRKCMEAAIEHLVWLLYPKFAHYTFTLAAFRIAKLRIAGRGMTLVNSYVLLQFLWLEVTLFGPCLPILNTLVALLANIYSILLFGCQARMPGGSDAQLLDVTETHAASIPSFGFSTVASLALALQSSNLL